MQECPEISLSSPLRRGADLLCHRLVVRGTLDRTEDTERCCTNRLERQPREREGDARLDARRIVHEQIADVGSDNLG